MKNIIILTIAFFASVLSIMGQSTDKIIKINGDTLNVIVSNLSESTITFSYPKETVTTTINRKIVKQIVFQSGRVESISEPIVITGEMDYEKVIITKDPNEVMGLIKKGDIQSKASKYKGKESKLRELATNDLRKEAAKKGGFIILILSDSFSVSSFNNMTLTGVAYGY